MKRQVQQTGIRKYFGADLVELQGEPLKVLDSLFAEYGPCVIQGCEPSVAEDGTYDIAPGLVALRTADPEGAERVMAMPFGGARGISLPVWLVAEDTVQERVYGDGKVKPVAHSYSAVVTASEPAGGVSSLQITAQGAPRLVDVLQDAAHRFVSDADKAKWDARVSAAQLADALAAKADTTAMETALAGKANVNGDGTKDFEAKSLNAGYLNLTAKSTSNYMYIGRGDKISSTYPDNEVTVYNIAPLGTVRFVCADNPCYSPINNPDIRHAIWHSGNFDPAAKVDRTGGSINGVLSFGNAGAAGFAPQGETQPKFQLYAWDQLLQLTRRGANGDYMDSVFNVSYETGTVDFVNNPTVGGHPVWHSANFDPASCMRQLGRFVPGTSIDDTGIGCGFNYANSGSNVNGSFLTFGHPGYEVELVTGYSSWQNGDAIMQFRTKNGDNGTWNPWRTIYSTGNLGPASAAADGLMTAADKRKLDATPRIIWGSVDSYGNYLSGKGFYARGLSGDYIKIEHTLGTVKYALTATVVAYGNNTYRDNYVSVMEKNTDYCLLAVLNGNGNTIERAVVDFQIVY